MHRPDTIPEGYMLASDGALVPEGKVKPEHKLEDEMARDVVGRAIALSQALADFKWEALGKAQDFRVLLDQEYEVKRGGQRGNMTFRSYDGTMELQVAVSDNLHFGPELEQAKALIDECIGAWSQGANDEIRALVDHAFQVGKAGRIDTSRVLSLRRLDIRDATWKRAMEAVTDALRVDSSTTYIRFYHRDPERGTRRAIPLDVAKL